MEKILASVKDFLFTGNNLTVVIVLVAIVLILLLAIIITSIKKRNVERKVAEEEAMLSEEEKAESKSLALETIVLSPIADEEIKEDSGAVVVNNETAMQVADETVIMTPVREKKRPIKNKNKEVHVPQERVSSFGEPNPSSNDGKLPGNIQIYVDTTGKYRFRFHSSNKFTLGHSQAYSTKSACKYGIQAVIRAAEKATIVEVDSDKYVSLIGKSVFEIYKDNDKKFRFRLMSANAMNILASQGYSSKINCLKGIESIKRIAEYHTITDDTQL